ncbi:hypothetical protein UFOVP182_30 [uncultured Caudovirales phage]|uniref:Terminase small subunit n=1 Tax=uncultured Caudovirales phage TaxID=2100421 RepID=A0A6J7WGD0_9CAUD|nr:hypothetical protein UFOVP182_30 [uncultured Caudovirales phage]
MAKKLSKKNLDVNQVRFLKHLEESLSIVSAAIEASNTSRSTYNNWMETNEDFRLNVELIKEKQIDFVESKLLQKIELGDTAAITFYLKTKGRARGYMEKGEMDQGDKLVQINITGIDRRNVEVKPIDITPITKKIDKGNGSINDKS